MHTTRSVVPQGEPRHDQVAEQHLPSGQPLALFAQAGGSRDPNRLYIRCKKNAG